MAQKSVFILSVFLLVLSSQQALSGHTDSKIENSLLRMAVPEQSLVETVRSLSSEAARERTVHMWALSRIFDIVTPLQNIDFEKRQEWQGELVAVLTAEFEDSVIASADRALRELLSASPAKLNEDEITQLALAGTRGVSHEGEKIIRKLLVDHVSHHKLAEVWKQRLAEKDNQVKYSALRGLSQLGEAAITAQEVIEPILYTGKRSSNTNWNLVKHAIDAIGAMGPKAKSSMDPLVDIAENNYFESEARSKALKAMAAIESGSKRVKTTLSQSLLRNEVYRVQSTGIELFWQLYSNQKLGDDISSFLDHLLKLAFLEDHTQAMMPILAEIAKDPRHHLSIVQTLIKVIQSPQTEIISKGYAAKYLDELIKELDDDIPEKSEAIATLRNLASNDNQLIRAVAYESLGNCNPPATLRADINKLLRTQLEKDDIYPAAIASLALHHLGQQLTSTEYAPILKALGDKTSHKPVLKRILEGIPVESVPQQIIQPLFNQLVGTIDEDALNDHKGLLNYLFNLGHRDPTVAQNDFFTQLYLKSGSGKRKKEILKIFLQASLSRFQAFLQTLDDLPNGQELQLAMLLIFGLSLEGNEIPMEFIDEIAKQKRWTYRVMATRILMQQPCEDKECKDKRFQILSKLISSLTEYSTVKENAIKTLIDTGEPNKDNLKLLLSYQYGRLFEDLASKASLETVVSVNLEDTFGYFNLPTSTAGNIYADLGRKNLDELANYLGHDAPRVRQGVLRGFKDLAKEGRSKHHLIKPFLQDPNIDTRIFAIQALASVPITDHEIENQLLSLWDSGTEDVKDVVLALGSVAQPSQATLDRLVKGLGDKNKLIKITSAMSLGKLGIKEDRIVNALIQVLESYEKGAHGEIWDYAVQKAVAEALVKLSDPTDKILEALKNTSGHIRVSSLLAFGPEIAKKHEDVLYLALDNAGFYKKGDLAKTYLEQLGEFGENLLYRAFNDRESITAFGSAMGDHGKLKNERMFQSLVSQVERGEPGASNWSAYALSKVGKKGTDFLLQIAKESKDITVQHYAIEALKNAKEDRKHIRGKLLEMLADEKLRLEIKNDIMISLSWIADDDPKVIEAITNDSSIYGTGEALARIGRPALEPLIEKYKKQPPAVRKSYFLRDVRGYFISEEDRAWFVDQMIPLLSTVNSGDYQYMVEMITETGQASLPALNTILEDHLEKGLNKDGLGYIYKDIFEKVFEVQERTYSAR